MLCNLNISYFSLKFTKKTDSHSLSRPRAHSHPRGFRANFAKNGANSPSHSKVPLRAVHKGYTEEVGKHFECFWCIFNCTLALNLHPADCRCELPSGMSFDIALCLISTRCQEHIAMLHDRLWLLREMAQAALYYNPSKLASTPTNPAMHWEVARMYSEPKSTNLVDACFFCDSTPHITCLECNVVHCTLHASILCQSEICVGVHQFWAAILAAAVPFAVVGDADVNTHPGVRVCCKLYVVPPQYPQNVHGQLRNDQ